MDSIEPIVSLRRINSPNEPGAYAVSVDGTPVGRVLTDVTRVWCAFSSSSALVAAVGRRRDAVAALVAFSRGEQHWALDED